MKIRKVFIGLFVSFFAVGTLIATSANFSIGRRAVNNSNDKAKVAKSADDQIVELGPDNIAGRVRALIFDNQDSTNQTMYAGGIAGGLFKTTDGGEHWTQVPMYLASGVQVNLPISCMTQTSDGVIYIGTGEGFVETGMNNHVSTPVGRGLYRMVNDTSYAVIPATAPVSDTISSNTDEWAFINRLAAAEYNNVLYFYAATNSGLYRWKIQSDSDWNNAPVKIFSGAVQDVDLSLVKKILFFTSTNKIYKITNVESDSQQFVEISSNYIDTSNISRIEVAVAPSDENYVYAVVADTNGLSKGVYMTNNQQVWEIITTSTTNIFSSKKSGWHNNAITVFPDNPKKIAVGGNALWIGEGFEGATLYTWTKSAYTENDLNVGDYMNNVYSSSSFVHSGIHNIVFPAHLNTSADQRTFFIATDGGVFSTSNAGNSFTMRNYGLKTLQSYSIAVANDASVLSGAQDNAVSFIASRNASDNGTLNTTAQVIWRGSGAGVASSMFQLLSPINRRCIFVSSEQSAIGRAYADYNDYTNTQTWSIGNDFHNGNIVNGPDVTPMLLWETTTDTRIEDSVTFTLDTNSKVKRGNEELYVRNPDLSDTARMDFTIQAGDTILVRSRGHFDYPFQYVFPTTFVAKDKLTHTVKNPIQNRFFVASLNGISNMVYMCNTATDFSRSESGMSWISLINFRKSVPHCLAISNDGDCLYIAIDDVDGGSRLVRFKNLLSGNSSTVLSYYPGDPNSPCVIDVDTVVFNGSDKLARRITSIAVDPRQGTDNIVVTCGDFEDEPNLYYITNAANNYNVSAKNVVAKTMPLYSSMIEMTTGNVYVGSENGLFITSNIASAQPTWNLHGNFVGTPVFAIKQQTNSMRYKETTYLSGANEEQYAWGKTKYPGAIYYATYGHGLYMDKQYITDTVNEIAIDDATPVASQNGIKVYPNPAFGLAHVDFAVAQSTTADIQVYDMSGRVVYTKALGKVETGLHSQVIPCDKFNKGVYVVRVVAGTQPMTSKLIVK